jgi:hypothetical protein
MNGNFLLRMNRRNWRKQIYNAAPEPGRGCFILRQVRSNLFSILIVKLNEITRVLS